MLAADLTFALTADLTFDLAVEAGCGHGFHPHPGMARQPQPGVGSDLGQPLGQGPGAADLHGARVGAVLGHRQTRGLQGRGDGGIARHQGDEHLLGAEGAGPTASDRIQVIRGDQSMQEQVGEPGEALGPQQGHVGIGHPALAARLAPFGLDRLCGHQVELGQQRTPLLVEAYRRQALAPLASFLPALLATGGDQLVGPEQGPLAFEVLELGQFLPLVMQTGVVFDHGLVAVAAEALVAVGAPQFRSDLGPGALAELGIFHGPGGIANHREAGAVDLFAGRFPRQQAPQGASQPHDCVVGDHQTAAVIAVGAEQVEALQGFKGGLHQAD